MAAEKSNSCVLLQRLCCFPSPSLCGPAQTSGGNAGGIAVWMHLFINFLALGPNESSSITVSFTFKLIPSKAKLNVQWEESGASCHLSIPSGELGRGGRKGRYSERKVRWCESWESESSVWFQHFDRVIGTKARKRTAADSFRDARC